MKSVMVHQFSQVPVADVPRSSFRRDSTYKTTFDSGYLVPFFVDEALPGDTFNVHVKLFSRLATPVVPIMDNLYLDWFFFAVPNRLVWSHWKNFCGERSEPDVVYEGTVPQVQSGADGFDVGSVADYFGLPVNVGPISVSALPFRAYNLIYNEWFRAEDLIARAPQHSDDATYNISDYPLRRRGKRFDYFTACNPWPLKGPESTISLGASAPVVDTSLKATPFAYVNANGAVKYGNLNLMSSSGSPASHEVRFVGNNSVSSQLITNSIDGLDGQNTNATPLKMMPSNLIADLSQATPISINDFRRAVALQHWYERLAQGGSRYTEVIRSVFGVVSPDARLQRPEYLGGGSTRVNINSVPQTSATELTDTGTPQGNLAAFAVASDEGGFIKSFTEHSIIIGLVSVRADLTYQQGVERMWSRKTLEEFYWPQFAHIGEQAVLNKEIFFSGVSSTDEEVFGYQERYAEYRYKPSKITGKLRSGVSGSLDVWHLAQYFTSTPRLNEAFINENPPVDRVIAVPSEPQFIFDSQVLCNCVRPMPVYGTPGLNRL